MMFKGDWGCFPNKQICEDCTEGKIEKMSEPVQVYTACQFVKQYNLTKLFEYSISQQKCMKDFFIYHTPIFQMNVSTD